MILKHCPCNKRDLSLVAQPIKEKSTFDRYKLQSIYRTLLASTRKLEIWKHAVNVLMRVSFITLITPVLFKIIKFFFTNYLLIPRPDKDILQTPKTIRTGHTDRICNSNACCSGFSQRLAVRLGIIQASCLKRCRRLRQPERRSAVLNKSDDTFPSPG